MSGYAALTRPTPNTLTVAEPGNEKPEEKYMRILHTMLRVGDLDRAIDFYTKVLGMRLLRRQDYPEGRFTLAFVGYGAESEQSVLELTYNWDTSAYDLGTGYGHIALEVDDV